MMMLQSAIGDRMPDVVMVMPVVARVVIRVARIVVVTRLSRLSLGVLLILHASVLEPDLHLAFGEHQTPRQFPALLFGDVRVVEEFLLEFERLVFGVGFPLFPHRHLAGPF